MDSAIDCDVFLGTPDCIALHGFVVDRRRCCTPYNSNKNQLHSDGDDPMVDDWFDGDLMGGG